MVHLEATWTTTVPVHPGTEGFDSQKVVVQGHEYPALQQPAQRKIAYLWSHPNSFHKETLHPIMSRFITKIRSLKEYDSTDLHLYTWDVRNHGDSARLNEGTLTEKYTCVDVALDTSQIIKELSLREKYDTLIGVGHSMGALSLLLCEFMHPKSFDGLCVSEPILNDIVPDLQMIIHVPSIAQILKRPDEWKNREECRQQLQRRPPWKTLHPEVFENYLNYGLYDTQHGTVKLKCPKEHEYDGFRAGPYTASIVVHGFPTLNLPIHIILADRSLFTDLSLYERLKQSAPLMTYEVVKGTHLFPFENPEMTVDQIVALTGKVQSLSKSSKL